MEIELIAGIFLIAYGSLGWAGYYLTVQEKQRDRDKLPENIKQLYLGDQ